jgi:hypothetical protein
MKFYNDQRNAQVFNLFFIYFCLTCLGLSFSPSSEAGVQLRQWFKTRGYGVSARALTPYPKRKSSQNVAQPSLKLTVCQVITRVRQFPDDAGTHFSHACNTSCLQSQE